MTDKFTLIHAEKATHSVELMTRLLHVSRAGYYSWVKRRDTPSPAATRRAEVTAAVIHSHTASNGVNGHRRVRADLTADGVPASEGMVRSIMRQAGIAGIQPRTKKRTTIPADDAEQRPDLVKRDFTSDTAGTKLVGDITYLRTSEGWLYLATVIDLHSRMVVGWAMAEHMRTELISAALRMAHTHGHLAPGAIFHSDRGSQGGFHWSSQHLVLGGVQGWQRRTGAGRPVMLRSRCVGSGARTGRCVRRCVPRGDRIRRGWCNASSGARSPRASRQRKRR